MKNYNLRKETKKRSVKNNIQAQKTNVVFGKRHVFIIVIVLIVWFMVPFIHYENVSTIAMIISIILCIWNTYTSMFLLGLIESSWQESRLRDVLLTPGQLIMGALLVRAFFKPGLNASFKLFFKSPTWFQLNFYIFIFSTISVSLYWSDYLYLYSAIIFCVSVVCLFGLINTIKDIKLGMTCLFIGLLPIIIYQILVIVGILEPIRSYGFLDGKYMFSSGRMNPNAVAASLTLLGTSGLFISEYYSTVKTKSIIIILASASFLFITITGSRSGMLSAALALLLYSYYKVSKNVNNRFFLIPILASALFILISLAPEDNAIFKNINFTMNRFIDEAEMDNSSSFRKFIWSAAISEINDNPFFPNYKEFRNKYLFMSHNTFLEIGLQGGILSMFSLALIYFGALLKNIRNYIKYHSIIFLMLFSLLLVRLIPFNTTAMPSDKVFIWLTVFTLVIKHNQTIKN